MVPDNYRIHLLNKNTMSNILFSIAAILEVVWVVGYFGYNAGDLIHLLIIIAIIVTLLRVVTGRKTL